MSFNGQSGPVGSLADELLIFRWVKLLPTSRWVVVRLRMAGGASYQRPVTTKSKSRTTHHSSSAGGAVMVSTGSPGGPERSKSIWSYHAWEVRYSFPSLWTEFNESVISGCVWKSGKVPQYEEVVKHVAKKEVRDLENVSLPLGSADNAQYKELVRMRRFIKLMREDEQEARNSETTSHPWLSLARDLTNVPEDKTKLLCIRSKLALYRREVQFAAIPNLRGIGYKGFGE